MFDGSCYRLATYSWPTLAFGSQLKVRRIAQKRGRKLLTQHTEDARRYGRLIFLAEKEQQTRPPLMIGRQRRIISKHIRAKSHQGSGINEIGKVRRQNRLHNLVVISAVQLRSEEHTSE